MNIEIIETSRLKYISSIITQRIKSKSIKYLYFLVRHDAVRKGSYQKKELFIVILIFDKWTFALNSQILVI